MNMEDHRGGITGTVQGRHQRGGCRRAVIAVNAENGARFVATTDAQGTYSFGALPVGNYDVSIVDRGTDSVQAARGGRGGRSIGDARHHDWMPASPLRPPTLSDRSCCSGIATLEQRIGDLESTTVLSEPETRVRRVEVFVDPDGNEHDEPVAGRQAGRHVSARACLPPPDDQRENRGSAGRCREQNVRVGVDAAIATQLAAPDGRGPRGQRARVCAGVGRSVLHGGPGAEHTLLRRHRRPERIAARCRNSVARRS